MWDTLPMWEKWITVIVIVGIVFILSRPSRDDNSLN
jgi:hypothetical protein